MTTKRIINCGFILKKVALAIIITGIFSGNIDAQNRPQTPAKVEATIALSFNKNKDSHKTALAIVKVKEEGKFVFARNAWVNFYAMHNNQLQQLRQVVTDSKGQASLELTKDIPLDDSLYFTIVAKIENDKDYEDASEQMHYKEASLALVVNAADTNKTVVAKVTEMSKGGQEVAVKGVEVKFFVQRLFGVLPASEDFTVTTDDKGEATFTYPKKIAGDTAGVVTIVAKMVDNDKFGNVENKVATNWGTHLPFIKDPFPRELWSPYAPWPLVITITTLFGGVWCVYCFLFFQMWKIKQDAKKLAKS